MEVHFEILFLLKCETEWIPPPPPKKRVKNVNLQTVVHDVHPDLSSYKFLLVYCIGIH